MFESDYQLVEQPDPSLRLRKSIPPFVKRRLVAIYHGRFCFKMPGLRCGPKETRWKREVGQQETLTLGVSYQGVGVGFSLAKTYNEALELIIGPNDSVMPVWCHDNSELHVYISSSVLTAHRWRRDVKSFFGSDPGFFDGNYQKNDPACRPHKPVQQTLPPIAGAAGAERPSAGRAIAQIIESTSFSPIGWDVELDSPDVVAAAAAQVLESDLHPEFELPEDEDFLYSAGLVDLDGSVSWFVVDGKPVDRPAGLCVASVDLVTRGQGFLSVSDEDRERPIPLLAFGGPLGAVAADIRVLADGGHELSSSDAAVREDHLRLAHAPDGIDVTTLWGTADLRGIPDGVKGVVHSRLYSSEGDVVGELSLPFWTEEQPEAVGAGTAERVGYGSPA